MIDPRAQESRMRLSRAIGLVAAVFLAVYSRYYRAIDSIPLFGAPQEWFLELHVGERFARCGFLRTALLPDYSTSADCRERPLVYTHQAPLPSVTLGLLRACGLDLPALRLPFAFAACLGIGLLAAFCGELTGAASAGAAAGIFAVASFNGSLVWSDHPVHSLFWLSYFGAMYFFIRREETRANLAGRMFFLLLALATSFMWATSILVTQALFAALDRDRRTLKRLGQSVLAAAAFVAVLLLRNAAYLGPGAAAKDLYYTLSNRIRGVPSRQELAAFYGEHGIVLWGVEKGDDRFLFSWLGAIMARLRPFLLVLAASAGLQWRSQGLRARPWRLLAVPMGILSWYLVFPALGRYYPLPYLIRTCEAVVIAGSAAEIAFWASRRPDRPARLAAFALMAALYWGPARQTAGSLRQPVLEGAAEDQADMYRGFQALSALPASQAVWTNLDSAVVRRHSASGVIGSCTEEAFLKEDPDLCYGAQGAGRARLIFLSTRLIPGTLLCQEDCVADLAVRLGRRRPLVAKSPMGHWWLFGAADAGGQ